MDSINGTRETSGPRFEGIQPVATNDVITQQPERAFSVKALVKRLQEDLSLFMLRLKFFFFYFYPESPLRAISIKFALQLWVVRNPVSARKEK